MSHPWDHKQLAVIRANQHLTDEGLIPLVNAVGPERTAKGIGDARRKRLGIKRVATKADHSKGGKKGGGLSSGWPSMKGEPEERDARFVELVLRGWAELQGWKVAA